MSDKIIQDISVESMVVGMLFRKPDLLNEYMELIYPEYDFSEVGLRFMYNVLIETFLNSDVVNETSVNITISKLDEASQKLFKDMGGFKLFQRLAVISEVSDDFKKYYEQLKSYNILRHLHNKGFAVEKNLEKLKSKNVDQILNAFELQLIKASSYIKGINDSIRLGDDILEVYESLKQTPDIGISLPFSIVETLARGWRTGKLYASAMHSGFGKSRLIAFILCYTSIVNQTPVLFCVNEQEKQEIDLMILTCIANNVFGKKYGCYVEETDIALGRCSGKKDEMVREAALYIKERSKIQFLELQAWDFNTLKMILKKHKLKGVNHVVIDTFKAMRGVDTHGMADWMQFVYTAEQLKKIIGSEAKGGLNMGLWLTMQMTDETLISKVMGSSAIATGKQTKHHMDYLQMSRMLDGKDKTKIKVRIEIPDNPFNGQVQPLDIQKTYYLTFVDKNRGGKDKTYIIYEVDKGKMIWKELGYAVFNSDAEAEEYVNNL